MVKVKFKKVAEGAVAPMRVHSSDAGWDLTAAWRREEGGLMVYGLGVAVEIPEGYVGLVFPRSSIARVDLALSNCVGVIDSGYRGEILAKFRPAAMMYGDYRGYGEKLYEIGERVAQLVIVKLPEVGFEEVEELGGSERGEGGYGSSGM